MNKKWMDFCNLIIIIHLNILLHNLTFLIFPLEKVGRIVFRMNLQWSSTTSVNEYFNSSRRTISAFKSQYMYSVDIFMKKKLWSNVYFVKIFFFKKFEKHVQMFSTYKSVWSFRKILDHDVFHEFWVRNHKRWCASEK